MTNIIDNIFSLFGVDFFSILWNFIKAIGNFFITIYTTISHFLAYLYTFNPIIGTIFLLGVSFSLFFGILKLIKLIPML